MFFICCYKSDKIMDNKDNKSECSDDNGSSPLEENIIYLVLKLKLNNMKNKTKKQVENINNSNEKLLLSDVSKRLNKVHVIIKSESVDYHGCYDEIVEIYNNIEDAEKKKKELLEENNKCNIDYFIDTYNVICR